MAAGALDFIRREESRGRGVPLRVMRFDPLGFSDARKEKLIWQQPGPLPLESMCRDTPAGALNIPLHRAAERFWREGGYLA